ncbi:penicillin-binding protein activator [Sutterella massiliensis]|uniref:Penicillin-binding protein activator n=2 Tax=Sutterella massiliensis TaxID=1816689 RepID=A0ABS2DNT7_9BURK|nr:penicillin-binding protein activator [Sutterella massiliensis]MBM6703038.1 penicillin-binding protein activator [Sutterella massiliensis]
MPTWRPLTIAVLMPQDGSPFMAAAKIVCNGLTAASKTSGQAAEILLIEATSSASLDNQLEAAIASGADVVVGPLERNAVTELAYRESLPLPTVALNVPSQALSGAAPENLIMMSVSTESEANYIAGLAAKALPAASERYGEAKVAIITSSDAWEQRIAEAFEQTLAHANVSYEVIEVTDETLPTLQKRTEPTLTEEEESVFQAKKAQAYKDYPAGTTALKRRIAAINAERRAKIATSEPPFQAALLALDAQSASLVRNRLHQQMRIWATSASNPGDPRESSTASALAYDLDKMVFSDCPIVVRYDAQGFTARFESAMPYSLAAKRLFALGADAYELARLWSSKEQRIQFDGETGHLTLDRQLSPEVLRTPQTIVIQSGELLEAEPEAVAQTRLPHIESPDTAAVSGLTESNASTEAVSPASDKPLVQVDEVFNDVRRTDVKSIVIDPQQSLPDPIPTPMLPAKPKPLPENGTAAQMPSGAAPSPISQDFAPLHRETAVETIPPELSVEPQTDSASTFGQPNH